MNAIIIFHIVFLLSFFDSPINSPASMVLFVGEAQVPSAFCVFGVFEGLGSHSFAGLDGVDGLSGGVVDIDRDVVCVFDVELPVLEPLQVYQISDVFLLLLIVNHVPSVEMPHELLLHFLLNENIEHLSKFTEIEETFGHL